VRNVAAERAAQTKEPAAMKIWTRMEFDQEEERQARRLSRMEGMDRFPFATHLEYIKEVKTGLEVDFLYGRETIGNA
jgi:hypothetical protein